MMNLDLAAIAAIVLSLIGAVFGLMKKSERAGKSARDIEAMKADNATDRRIDHADTSDGDTNADAEWVRSRAERARSTGKDGKIDR